jgi:hypothetical protein
MFRKLSVLMLAMVLVTGASTAVQAQHRGNPHGGNPHGGNPHGGTWVLLGERHIDGRADNDKIDVGQDNGRFRAIQFRVEGGSVMFDRIRVKYLRGASEDFSVRSDIPDGGSTRAIDLPGERRVIESVSMWYSKRNWRSRPTVRVYGIR